MIINGFEPRKKIDKVTKLTLIGKKLDKMYEGLKKKEEEIENKTVDVLARISKSTMRVNHIQRTLSTNCPIGFDEKKATFDAIGKVGMFLDDALLKRKILAMEWLSNTTKLYVKQSALI